MGSSVVLGGSRGRGGVLQGRIKWIDHATLRSYNGAKSMD
jgi:hypothetical protein